jgi:HEPN domain-containing protein
MDFPKVHDVGMVFSNGAKEKGVSLSEDVLTRIQEVQSGFTEARAPAFYVERNYSKEDASKAKRDSTFVLRTVKTTILKSAK